MNFNKLNVSLIVLVALLCGTGIGYFAGHGSSQETYQVPGRNTCGPEALSAVLAELKVEASSQRIAELSGTDSEGTTMLGLKRAAEALGLKAMGSRLTQSELEAHLKRGSGIIAFVNGNHYVAIKGVHPKGVVIKDTQPGFQFVPYDKWSAMWFERKGGRIPSIEEGRGICLVVYPKN